MSWGLLHLNCCPSIVCCEHFQFFFGLFSLFCSFPFITPVFVYCIWRSLYSHYYHFYLLPAFLFMLIYLPFLICPRPDEKRRFANLIFFFLSIGGPAHRRSHSLFFSTFLSGPMFERRPERSGTSVEDNTRLLIPHTLHTPPNSRLLSFFVFYRGTRFRIFFGPSFDETTSSFIVFALFTFYTSIVVVCFLFLVLSFVLVLLYPRIGPYKERKKRGGYGARRNSVTQRKRD